MRLLQRQLNAAFWRHIQQFKWRPKMTEDTLTMNKHWRHIDESERQKDCRIVRENLPPFLKVSSESVHTCPHYCRCLVCASEFYFISLLSPTAHPILRGRPSQLCCNTPARPDPPGERTACCPRDKQNSCAKLSTKQNAHQTKLI